MKYKVGDKVRIRSDLKSDSTYGGIYVNSYMIEYCGQIVTINKINIWTYEIEEDGQDFNWSDEMIEGKVEDMEEEINIQCMEELKDDGIFSATIIQAKINEIIQAVKQLDKQVKENK